jgi:hypothetical protein
MIATLIGLLAALAVALFRHAMVVLETLFLGNDSGSPTKHHLHVRIGMKTVHRSWRESENMALL